MLQNSEMKLILASKSTGRVALLRGAGLEFDSIPADVDERAIEETLRANEAAPDPADVALLLAIAKAQYISEHEPDAYVIGADQVLALGDEIFEKPASMEIARDNLLKFRGRTHHLHAAVCVCRDGDILWSEVDSAAMTMRDFSGEFLGNYLATAGETVKTSVGAYRLEGVGVHLFERIDGDYFTILGLPLVPLLDFMRKEGLVIS